MKTIDAGDELLATIEAGEVTHEQAHIRPRPIALSPRPTEEDLAAHALLRADLGQPAIWSDYLGGSA